MKEQVEEMARIIDDNHGFVVSSVETAEALYNAGYRKQNGWISVEDGLPEEHNDYLVAVRYFSTTFVRKQSYSKERGWYGVQDGHYYTEKDVTHWMPLPEPPKMKGGAE